MADRTRGASSDPPAPSHFSSLADGHLEFIFQSAARTASAAITRYILRKVRATGAVEPMGPWAMGHLALLNFASSKTYGKTDQMWFYYRGIGSNLNMGGQTVKRISDNHVVSIP